MSVITFEQQQIFKDAITEVQMSIDAVLYGVRVDSVDHQRRNFETMIDLSSVFGRVFESIPSFSKRFRALFKVLNMSRSIFLENKVELFLSSIRAVLHSWRDLFKDPCTCSTGEIAQVREDGAADSISNKPVQPISDVSGAGDFSKSFTGGGEEVKPAPSLSTKIGHSLQSLGLVDTGFIEDCPLCATEYWRTLDAADAALCPMCGTSGLVAPEFVLAES